MCPMLDIARTRRLLVRVAIRAARDRDIPPLHPTPHRPLVSTTALDRRAVHLRHVDLAHLPPSRPKETKRLARDPFLAYRFRDALDRGDTDIFRNFDLVRFADRIGLRPLERLVLASSIASQPSRKEFAQQAATIIRIDFENAVLLRSIMRICLRARYSSCSRISWIVRQ